MTESRTTYTWEGAIRAEAEAAGLSWAARHRGKGSEEEALNVSRLMTTIHITDHPGGRLVIYTEVHGKRPQSKHTTYNRYQRIPDNGYVRVYHRDM